MRNQRVGIWTGGGGITWAYVNATTDTTMTLTCHRVNASGTQYGDSFSVSAIVYEGCTQWANAQPRITAGKIIPVYKRGATWYCLWPITNSGACA